MPIRVLHVVAHTGYGALPADLGLLLPRLQTPDMFARAVTLHGTPLPDGAAQLPFIDVGLSGIAGVAGFARLVRAIRTFRPDLVHTHGCAAKYWALIAAWLAGVKKIVHTERNGGNGGGRAMPYWACMLCKKFVTFLPEHAREIAKTCGIPHVKIAVIPKGLPVTPQATPQKRRSARALLGIPDGPLCLLAAQCIGLSQNPELALRALAAIPPDMRARVVLILAGMESSETALRQICSDLDIRESVRFMGDRTDVESILPAADLFLLTSFFEEMPVVLIKAMLTGVAIVTTPWLGSGTMLGNGLYGFITAGWEAGDVALEILRAMRSEAARTALVNRAYAHARAEYDIENVAEAHRRLYREVCAMPLLPASYSEEVRLAGPRRKTFL